MGMTDGSKGRIIIHKVLISRLICPVDCVDGIRLIIAVLDSLLVAVKFLSVEDERNTLGSIYRSLGKLDHSETVFLGCLCRDLKAVTQTVVVMAAGIAHMLKRAACPRLHTYLRMLHASCYTELEVSLLAFDSVHETGILATERAADGIADIVAECADPVKHVCIVLEGDLL